MMLALQQRLLPNVDDEVLAGVAAAEAAAAGAVREAAAAAVAADAPDKMPAAAAVTLCTCPPDWAMCGRVCAANLRGASECVGDFVANALIYVVSKLWSDTIAIYCFGLMAPWFCGLGYDDIECTPPASSSSWALYTLVLLPLTGLCKHLAELRMERAEQVGGRKGARSGLWLPLVPSIMNYVVGWAAGNTALFKLAEVRAASGCEVEAAGGCTALNLGFSGGCTVAAALFITLLKPFVAEVEWGSGPLIDWVEDWVEDVLAMLSRGLTVVVMMLWYHAANDYLFLGVAAGSYGHISFISAGFLTFAGALLSVRLEELEKQIDAHLGPAGGVAIELSNLVQSVLAYVTGCACSDWVTFAFPSLSAPPASAGVIVANVALCAALVLLCVAWLVATGESGQLDTSMQTDREAMERFFLTNSMAFFVGWNLFVVSQNLIIPVGVAANDLLSDTGLSERRADLGERVVVLACVPLFSVTAFGGAFALIDVYKRRAGISKSTVVLDAPTDDTFKAPGMPGV